MIIRYLLYKVPVLVCLLITATAITNARTFPLEKISRGNQEFFGAVSYEVEKAYAGNHNLEVFVSLNTKGLKNLQMIKFEPPDQTKIRFTQISEVESFDAATGLRTTVYKYLADIPEGTEPRIYLPILSLGYPGDKNTNRTVWLYVGVRNKGKLNVIADSVNATEFYSGTTNTYRLELENNFPDFPVNVRSVTIKSDPVDLIESATLPIANTSIDALQRGAVDLKVKAAPFSFSNLLSGFGESRLVLNVTYDDGYGRVITDLSYPVKVKVRPRDRVLVLAMLVGVVIGAILRLYLQRLQKAGIITRREKLAAIGITSLIGLVVSFVALVGHIKIVAFDLTGSYDNPGVIFIICLAGTVGGAQLLSTFFNPGNGNTAAPGPGPNPQVVSSGVGK